MNNLINCYLYKSISILLQKKGTKSSLIRVDRMLFI